MAPPETGPDPDSAAELATEVDRLQDLIAEARRQTAKALSLEATCRTEARAAARERSRSRDLSAGFALGFLLGLGLGGVLLALVETFL